MHVITGDIHIEKISQILDIIQNTTVLTDFERTVVIDIFGLAKFKTRDEIAKELGTSSSTISRALLRSMPKLATIPLLKDLLDNIKEDESNFKLGHEKDYKGTHED